MQHAADSTSRSAQGGRLPRPRPRLTVAEVMSTRLVTVTPDTGFKRLASLMREHRISGLPVVDAAGHPLGVVSETDLLAKERRPALPLLTWLHPGRTIDHLRASGTTAGEVMTAPAATIPLHASVVVAARRLHDTGIRRLLVVDDKGRLAGLVTRNDLLGAFLRPDAEIRRDVEGILRRWPAAAVGRVRTSVEGGMVTLTGRVDCDEDVEALVELIGFVDGVISVNSADVEAADQDGAA
jgi:CBS domain-containing protein